MSGEIIVEFHQLGGQVKVSAIDILTGKEVSIIGALSVDNEDLAALAIRKLNYVLEKEKNNR